MGRFVPADLFQLTRATRIEGLSFWAFQDPFVDPFLGDIHWQIFRDAMGLPGNPVPFAAGMSPVAARVRTDIVTVERLWRHDVDVGPLLLGPGSYWLGLHAGPLTDLDRYVGYYWSTSGFVRGFGGEEFDGAHASYWPPSREEWRLVENDLAFRVVGTPVVTAEPSSLLLLLGGLFSLGLIARRERDLLTARGDQLIGDENAKPEG
jgi:hypothetical protein